jgi:hypothetical protein
MEYACYQDNERAVEFFINLACPCDHNSFLRAVENHNLEIVRRLQDYGCPWDVEVIVKAVDFGNLEFLEYLHRNGCPWNRDAFDILELRREVPRLFTRDHELCYQYLIENGCPQE